jgi:hypothetical protein
MTHARTKNLQTIRPKLEVCVYAWLLSFNLENPGYTGANGTSSHMHGACKFDYLAHVKLPAVNQCSSMFSLYWKLNPSISSRKVIRKMHLGNHKIEIVVLANHKLHDNAIFLG